MRMFDTYHIGQYGHSTGATNLEVLDIIEYGL